MVRKKKYVGFTLIEILMTTVILGLAMAALLVGNRSLTAANGAGTELSNAGFFIDQLRELTATLPVKDPTTGTAAFGAEETTLAAYDDLDDFNGKTYTPPIDSTRAAIAGYPGYSETITVENVSATDLKTHAANHSTAMYRVTVSIMLHDREVATTSWIRANY